MIVRLIADHKTYKKDHRIDVTRELGLKLIAEGKAISVVTANTSIVDEMRQEAESLKVKKAKKEE